GLVKILSEASIGSGVRRVEALVGLDAFRFLAREHVLVAQLAETFKAPPEEIPERVHGVIERLRAAAKELEKGRPAAGVARRGARGEGGGVGVGGGGGAEGVGGNALRRLAWDVRGRLEPGRPGVVVLVSATDGRAAFVATVNDAGRAAGQSAGAVVRALAPAV